MGNRFLSSAGVGKSCVLPIPVPNPSPTLDKNLASMGPRILSSSGVGVRRKAPETFPNSNTTLDTFQSAILDAEQTVLQGEFQTPTKLLLKILRQMNGVQKRRFYKKQTLSGAFLGGSFGPEKKIDPPPPVYA